MIGKMVLAVGAVGGASMAMAQGPITLDFGADACISAVITSPATRRAALENLARDEYRKPTTRELATIGASYEIMVWNTSTAECRNIIPSAFAVTDADDNLRSRFNLTVTDRSIRENAFGARGAFYTATLRLTEVALRRAFAADGIAHVITDGGKHSARFQGEAVAGIWETPAERRAREQEHERKLAEERQRLEAQQQAEARARAEALEEAQRQAEVEINVLLEKACGSQADLQSAAFRMAREKLQPDKARATAMPYKACIEGSWAEFDAAPLLELLK